MGCCLLSLLLLIPLLLWLCSWTPTSLPYDCYSGFEQFETNWSPAQQQFCCQTTGRGCQTALPETTPTVPPPTGFNCAVDAENTWAPAKREWCCRIHHRGCPTTAPPPQPIVVPVPQPIAPPADPYNCADGF